MPVSRKTRVTRAIAGIRFWASLAMAASSTARISPRFKDRVLRVLALAIFGRSTAEHDSP